MENYGHLSINQCRGHDRKQGHKNNWVSILLVTKQTSKQKPTCLEWCEQVGISRTKGRSGKPTLKGDARFKGRSHHMDYMDPGRDKALGLAVWIQHRGLFGHRD